MPRDPFSLSDILAGYGGSPDPENPSSGEITPGLLLRALQQADLGGSQAFGKMATDIATLPKRAIEGAAQYSPGIRREDVTDIPGTNQPADVAVAPATEAAMNLVGFGTGFAQPGSAGIFGGRLAKNAPKEAYAKADEMLAKGATREEIHDATGLTLGPEGMLKHEIPDIGSGFRPTAQQLPGAKLARTIGADVIPGPGLAEHVFAHPELYEAYPELRSLLFKFEDPYTDLNRPAGGFMARGAMDPVNRELYLNPDAFEPSMASRMDTKPGLAGMRSVTLHELQHEVQKLEGFARGASPQFPEVQQAADAAIAQRKTEAQAALDALYSRRDEWIAQKQAAGSTESPQTLASQFFAANPEAVRDSAELHRQLMGVPGERAREAIRQYKKVAGEVEARNVQKRADMTPEQLRDVPPDYTQDVPFNEQLISFFDPAKGYEGGAPSFTERMAGARDIAQQGRNRGGGFIPRSAPEQPPLLAPGETRGDVVRALTPGMAPAEPSIADVGRRSYRDRLGLERPNLQLSAELPPEMGDVAGPSMGVGSPRLRSGNAPLFDYSKLAEVPNVPQRDLPRVVPPEGVPEATQALAAPKNIARVNEAVRAGEAMGGRDWYNAEPLREQFVAELGEGPGNAAFRSYMEHVAATSPRTKIPENIRNASYYYGLTQRGEELPRTYLEGGYHRMVKSTQAPSPYGAMPIHIQNIQNVREGGLPVLQNPKPSSFVENLTGNQQPVTIDTHNMRLLTGAREAEVPKPNEYGFLERLQQEEAAKMGMTPAQYQASAWIGAGKETGLGSPTDPFLRVLEQRVALTAEQRGQTKAQVLRDFIRGQAPLLSLTPAAVLLGQAQPAQEPVQ